MVLKVLLFSTGHQSMLRLYSYTEGFPCSSAVYLIFTRHRQCRIIRNALSNTIDLDDFTEDLQEIRNLYFNLDSPRGVPELRSNRR